MIQTPTAANVIATPGRLPRQIARYGYAALFLFAIASTILGYGAGKLGTIILTAAVVFTFAVALLGFQRIATNYPDYRWIGMAAITITITAVLALCITTFVYIASGHPVWMDTWFKAGAKPEAVRASVERATTSSALIRLVPHKDSTAEIEFALFERSKLEPSREPFRVSATTEHVTLDLLEQGTAYRVRVTANSHGRESVPLDLAFATEATGLRLTAPAGANTAIYKGPLDPNGLATAATGSITYGLTSPPETWIYTGPVKAGLPHGHGAMNGVADCPQELELSSVGCGSACKSVEFESGNLGSADCSLVLAEPGWREVDKVYLTTGYGRYEGKLEGVKEGLARPITSVGVGPFRAVFSGAGALRTAKGDILNGTWKASALNGAAKMTAFTRVVREGEFADGNLKNGRVFNDGLLQGVARSYEVLNHQPVGAFIELSRVGFEFGILDGTAKLERGTKGKVYDDWLILERIDAGNTVPIKPYRATTPTESCVYEETFGLNIDVRAFAERGWVLHAVPDGEVVVPGQPGQRSTRVTLDNKATGLHISGFRKQGEATRIDGWLWLMDGSRAQSIAIDGVKMRLVDEGHASTGAAALALAKLCYAKVVKNLETNGEAVAENICPLIELMMARIQYC